jgi:cytochrome bd-type quinol oxidase subunit 2
MIKKIKLLILSMSSLFIIATPALVAGTAMAYSQADINACVAQGSNFVFDANSGTCTNTNVDDSNNLNNLIAKVINILSVVVGIVAVVMIIIAGLRYVTSGGKQESVTSAKNTILYAIIGLVIVALAQIIVHFVLKNVT